MKVKNHDLQLSTAAFQELMALKLPVPVALRIAKACQEIDGTLKAIESVRQQLLDRHCRKDESGERVIVDDRFQFTDERAFLAAYAELLEEEVDLAIEPVDCAALGQAEVQPATLAAISWFFAA